MSRIWRDNDLRLEAENLITRYGHLWPNPCEHINCTKPFPRSFKKDQAKSSSFNIRRFRCGGCKATVSVAIILAILRPVEQDPSAADEVVTAVMQRLRPVQSVFSQPAAPAAPVRHRNPMGRSLHVSDLESFHEDENMSDPGSHHEDDEDEDGPSPLLHFPNPRPLHYQTPPSPHYSYGTQVFATPLGQMPYQSGSPSYQSPGLPSHFSTWNPSQSPSLHPSQFSYMSGGTPVNIHPQAAPPQASVQHGPATPPPQEFHPTAGAGTSASHAKRRNLETSVWNQKQPRLDSQYQMSQQHAASIQLALDMSDRQNQQLTAQNQSMQNQMQALINEVAQLRKELQESRQAQATAKVASVPVPVPTPLAKPAPQPVPAPAPVPAPVATPVPVPTPVAATSQSDQEEVPAPVPAATATAAPTYASATREGLSAAQLAIIQSMKPPPRPFKARQPANPVPKPDRPPVRVYFSGVQSCPLKVFKEKMRALRVRTSQIYNISFVGKSICEFLVDASYQAKFIESMSSFTFRHLPNFDPAVPQDPNVTEETKDLLMQAYTRRLTSMAKTTDRGFVRSIFLDMLVAAGADVPTDLPPLDGPPMPANPASGEADVIMEPAAEDTAGTNDN
ncbi:hypothetical protein BGZ83_003371, partial [Gryganskiella cystojenkinii]